METIAWQIKKEEFGFPKRFCRDVEYNVGDNGIRIIRGGQLKLYSWEGLRWFSSGNLFSTIIGGWPIGSKIGSTGGFKAMFDVLSKNRLGFSPQWRKSFHEFNVYPKRDPLGVGLVRVYVFGRDIIKEVFEALKTHLPFWNNWFLPWLIVQTIVGVGFSAFCFYIGYLAAFEYSKKLFEAIISGTIFSVASLLVGYFTIRNIIYFFKLYKQKWRKSE